MNFALVIQGHPQADASLANALGFARATIALGHRIYRVFLYHDGVRIARPDYPDTTRLIAAWQQLAREHEFELVACISAAERRDVPRAGEPLRDGFVIAGLGQFTDCLLKADRTITFRP